MKKFCKNCGLLYSSETEQYGQFKCSECGHINKSKGLETVEEKMARFETCKNCGFTVRGTLIRKKGTLREYEYACKCGHGWKQEWKKTALKDRLKAVGKER